jgi:hypothetical protein
MPVLLSDEELQALEGLPHLHRCLYIFGIRRYMDYQTGITGIKREISYKSLSEEVYVNPHQGFKNTGSLSRDQIKRALIVLEQAGLIKRKSIVTKEEKQLILECELAKSAKSIQNKPAPNPPHSPALQAALEGIKGKNAGKPYKNSMGRAGADTTAEAKSRPASRPAHFEKAALHQISDTLHNITLHDNNVSPVDNSKPDAQAFFQLLGKQGYYLHQLHANKKTLAMVHAWIKAKVTLEEALIGINHVNAQLGKPPDTPTYYHKPVLQVREDFKSAEQPSEDLKHGSNDKRTQHTKPRLTHEQRRKRLADWAAKKERELETEEGPESDNVAI